MEKSCRKCALKGSPRPLFNFACLFNKSGDDMCLLLQRFESLVLKDELAARKQSSIFNIFEKKQFTHLYFYYHFKKYECSN